VREAWIFVDWMMLALAEELAGARWGCVGERTCTATTAARTAAVPVSQAWGAFKRG